MHCWLTLLGTSESDFKLALKVYARVSIWCNRSNTSRMIWFQSLPLMRWKFRFHQLRQCHSRRSCFLHCLVTYQAVSFPRVVPYSSITTSSVDQCWSWELQVDSRVQAANKVSFVFFHPTLEDIWICDNSASCVGPQFWAQFPELFYAFPSQLVPSWTY